MFFNADLSAQLLQGTLDSELNDETGHLIFSVRPSGGDLTAGITTFTATIRWAESEPDFTFSNLTINTTDFPDMAGLVFEANPNGDDAGFNSFVANWNVGTGTATEVTFTDNVEYEVFRVDLNFTSANEPVSFETVKDEFNFPYVFGISDDGVAVSNDAVSFYGTLAGGSTDNGFALQRELEENVALPINMKSFTAAPFENRDANLNWSTASEVNGSHFEVERSDDGVNFTQIGRVEATGNSSVDQDYKFSDREVNMQRASDLVKYYRIKLVDIDGEYKYSGIRVVNFTRSDIDFTVSAFPNPTVNYVQLELTGLDNTSEERPMLNMYSNTGELVRSERLNSDLGKIDMSNLPGSLYHFIIDYKGQRYTEKIVVIK